MKHRTLLTSALPLFVAATVILPNAASAQRDTSMSGARAEAAARTTADSIRRVVLGIATFAGFADSSCAPGDFRTFEGDTSGDAAAGLDKLQMLVLSYGAFAPLDNEAGRALMRALVRFEGGGPGPRWDVMSGLGPRAFNPILPARLLNTETKQCILTPGAEPNGIVLPPIADFVAAHDSGAADFTVGYGPRALNDIRNLFFSRHRNEANAIMRVTRVTSHAVWSDYAVVSVIRQQELRGVVAMPKETTGAVYVFHRIDGEWRMLAVARNW